MPGGESFSRKRPDSQSEKLELRRTLSLWAGEWARGRFGSGKVLAQENLSGEQLGNQLGMAHHLVGQAVLTAVARIGKPLVIEAEGMKEGRVQIWHRHDVFHGLVTEVVGRAVDVAPFEPA